MDTASTSASVRSPMSLVSSQGPEEEQAEAGPSAPPKRQKRTKGRTGQYSVKKDALFLEWWETYHPNQGDTAYSKHPDHEDLVQEFEQVFSRHEGEQETIEDIAAWRNIFKDGKTNAIEPMLKRYGWKTESIHLPISQGGGRYLKWTSTRNFANRLQGA